MSLETPTDSPNASSAPDWAAEEREILCPLCDYNLRGLTECRCPECGHQFTWSEVLERGQRHPYLYEHHRGNRIITWIRTFFASQFPWRFWRELRPTHEVRAGRLFTYALVTAVLTVLMAIPGLAISVADTMQANRTQRTRFLKIWSHPTAATQPDGFVRRYGSPQAAVNAAFPELSVIDAIQYVLDRRMIRYDWRRGFLFDSISRMLCWPILTILSVLIFRVSFRQAGIRFGHVLRTVVYSADVIVIAAALLALGEYFGSQRGSMWTQWYFSAMGVFAIPYFWIGLLAVLFVRLLLASTLYLRVPGGVAMVVASQIIVWLALAQITLLLQGYLL